MGTIDVAPVDHSQNAIQPNGKRGFGLLQTRQQLGDRGVIRKLNRRAGPSCDRRKPSSQPDFHIHDGTPLPVVLPLMLRRFLPAANRQVSSSFLLITSRILGPTSGRTKGKPRRGDSEIAR